MTYPQFDRFRVKMEPLSSRPNKKIIEQDHVPLNTPLKDLPQSSTTLIEELAERVKRARSADKPVMITFGAHAIKNGLGTVLLHLIEHNWVTHLATNGAGIIHDWEFAYQGKSCEDVEQMVNEGRFGNWEDTGFFINLALNVGAFEGLGYGASVGAMIEREGVTIPSAEELIQVAKQEIESAPEKAAAAADLLAVIQQFNLEAGWMEIAHPWKRFSIQAGAYRHSVPFTGHPMIGHDIIYNHPMNRCAALGRAAERDFLSFANSVSQLEGGVYISIGSAVMSPMVFEKSLSISQNIAIQNNDHIDDHFIFINDLAKSTWDWSRGEPPEDNPAYYLRYNKSFSRMGGEMRYLQADNRDFLLTLTRHLDGDLT